MFVCLFVCLSATVGKSKTVVVTACREAIKENDVESLIKVIKNGVP